MLIKLNEEKTSILAIGGHHFTFADPGPVDIDIENMTKRELNQLVYNLRRQMLTTTEDMTRLLELTKQLPASSKSFQTPEEQPMKIAEGVLDPHGRLEEDTKELKKILRGTTEQVLAASVDLSPARVRKLLDIELHQKKRAAVISHLERMVQTHTNRVSQTVGTEQPAKTQKDLVKKGLSATGINLDNIGDVVESEVGQITLNPYPED